MNDFIYVEPAHPQRPAFALWCLSQTPKIMTSSATGFDVPLDLYPAIPAELLEGSYVDGYLYDRPEPRPPVREAESIPPKPRKRAAKKVAAGAYTRKPSNVSPVQTKVPVRTKVPSLDPEEAHRDALANWNTSFSMMESTGHGSDTNGGSE